MPTRHDEKGQVKFACGNSRELELHSLSLAVCVCSVRVAIGWGICMAGRFIISLTYVHLIQL